MGGDHLWDEVGAIGQVLGSVAVFTTLGIWRYSSVIREQRCAVRSRKRVRDLPANCG